MVAQSHPKPVMPLVLLTRPEAQSHRFAAQLRRAFGPLDVLISPLMAPRFLLPAIPQESFTAILLTSETGAEAARRISASGQALPRLAFCVGDRTAAAAGAVGFEAISAQGDAGDLVRLMMSRRVNGPLLYLRGQDSRGDVAQELTRAGHPARSVICYDQVNQPLTPSAQKILAGDRPVLAPLFSPRTAMLFAREAEGAALRAPLWVVAMSAPVAAALEPIVPQRLKIAEHPDAGAMVRAVSLMLDDETAS